MPAIWRVRYEKMIDLKPEEVDAVLDAGNFVEEADEMYVGLDFDDPDEYMKELVEQFRKSVRPEVFEVIKTIAENGDNFTVV